VFFVVPVERLIATNAKCVMMIISVVQRDPRALLVHDVDRVVHDGHGLRGELAHEILRQTDRVLDGVVDLAVLEVNGSGEHGEGSGALAPAADREGFGQGPDDEEEGEEECAGSVRHGRW